MARLIVLWTAAAIALGACSGTGSVFEDRSHEVKIKHRIPNR